MAGKLDSISETIGELKSSTENHGKKLDSIASSISNIDITLAKQAEQLAQHIRRTELLENEVRPIKDHVVHVQALIRIAKWLIPLIGVPEAIYYSMEVIQWLKHFH